MARDSVLSASGVETIGVGLLNKRASFQRCAQCKGDVVVAHPLTGGFAPVHVDSMRASALLRAGLSRDKACRTFHRCAKCSGCGKSPGPTLADERENKSPASGDTGLDIKALPHEGIHTNPLGGRGSLAGTWESEAPTSAGVMTGRFFAETRQATKQCVYRCGVWACQVSYRSVLPGHRCSYLVWIKMLPPPMACSAPLS